MPIFPFLVHYQLPELAKTHVHWVSDAIQLPHVLSSPSLLAINLSQHQGLFKWDSSSHQIAKVLKLKLQHQSFQCIFRTDFLEIVCFDTLAVQVTLKSFLQHLSLKASILRHSSFIILQLFRPYMTTGKSIALTSWPFVHNVMSLLFTMLVR